ncbi:DUF6094 domain-containing protein [Bengtsoniella intestinalis]|uniref:DUF6094 domain-containing protein n=1 Tax=Bengtsoniella intestinalis TaxID=3073143 RepID=UPI00391FA8D2
MQPNETQRYYVLEQLHRLRQQIDDGIHGLVIGRARVEKYRAIDVTTAKDLYHTLEKDRDALVEVLGDTQRCLQEVEEYRLSQLAGTLRSGLAGFALSSSAYKPVYNVMIDFANKLPQPGQTTDAAIIGRLMNNVKLGYYPTGPQNIAYIKEAFSVPEGVEPNYLDPCCGCGLALSQLAQGQDCHTYGVELDESRGQQAESRLYRVGYGSFFHSHVSYDAFHLLFLNPPYLAVLGEGGNRTRHEKRFLVESYRNLTIGGLLVYIIPYYRLTPDICRVISDNFTDVTVWRFTDDEFKKFKQVAIMGRRKTRSEDIALAEQLDQLGYAPQNIPAIAQLPMERYHLPTITRQVSTFKGAQFNQKELSRQLAQSNSFQQMMCKHQHSQEQKRPLLPLSIGQVGLIGGSGLINGLVDCETPHIIKGRIVKVKRTEEHPQYNAKGKPSGGEIKEIISNKMIFNVLTPEGFRSLA